MITIDWTEILSHINPVYRPHISNYERKYISYGSAGSGKSIFAAQKKIINHLSKVSHQGRNTLVVRKTANTNRTSTFPLFRKILKDFKVFDYCKINNTEMLIELPNGNQIRFLGLDDTEKIKSITFDNGDLTDIWIEEATEISYEDYQSLDLRMRGQSKHPKQIMMTMNPISETHWIKKHFIDEKKEPAFILKTTFEDNIFLDQEYINKLRALKDIDEYYYQVYALGNWGILGETIFSNYEIIDFDVSAYANKPVMYGVDYGYHDPCVMLDVRMHDNDLYICREIYKSEILNNEFIELAESLGFVKSVLSTHDCSEADRIEEFKRAGWNAQPAAKGPGSIKAGIDWLKRRKIYVHAGNCPETAKEIKQYHYKKDRGGNVLDEPVDFNNHAMDALRYAVEGWRKELPEWEFW